MGRDGTHGLQAAAGQGAGPWREVADEKDTAVLSVGRGLSRGVGRVAVERHLQRVAVRLVQTAPQRSAIAQTHASLINLLLRLRTLLHKPMGELQPLDKFKSFGFRSARASCPCPVTVTDVHPACNVQRVKTVSYKHLRAHETDTHLV